MELPEELSTARQLWWTAIGCGLVQVIASVLAAMSQRDQFTADVVEQMHEVDPGFDSQDAHTLVSAAFVLAILLGVGLAALGLVIVQRMIRGRRWARTVLTIAGVWLVLMGISALFAFGAVTGAAGLVAGAVAIVQGVLAAGAVWLSYRPAASEYLQSQLKSR